MYNEESGAELCVRQVSAALDALRNRSALIVVDDGSRDGTADALRRIAPEAPRLIVVRHDANRGYGAALRTAAREADARGFEYVLYMDSDLTNSPDDILRFVAHMQEGVDVIKATSLTADAHLVFFSTSTLRESMADETRFDARYWDIWTVEER